MGKDKGQFNPYDEYMDNMINKYGGNFGQGNVKSNQEKTSGFGFDGKNPYDNMNFSNFGVTNPNNEYNGGYNYGKENSSKFGDTGVNMAAISGSGNKVNAEFLDGASGSALGEIGDSGIGYGEVAGSALAVAEGAGSIYGNVRDEVNIGRDYDTSVSGTYTDANGAPILTTQNEIENLDGLREEEAGKGLVGSSAAKGAAAGASVPGGLIVKGIGTAVGAIGGSIAGAFGKNKAEKAQTTAEIEAQKNIDTQNLAFNSANESYSARNTAQDLEEFNKRQQQMNLYGIPS